MDEMKPTGSPLLRLLFHAGNWLGMALFLLTGFLGDDRYSLVAIAAVVVVLMEFLFDFREDSSANVYRFMLFSPLLLIRFSSIPDFRIRFSTFLFLVYIFALAVSPRAMRFRISLERIRPACIWGLAFAVFSLAAVVMTWRGAYLSGDEPHYVMMAQSLIEDGDIDLKNNLERGTYRSFHPVSLDFHGGIYRGRHLPFHMPGLPLLLLPFYWVFSLVRVPLPPHLYFRLAASAINAFFALGLFQLLKTLFPLKKIAGFWLLLISTFPLLFHAVHLYPELPAGTLLLYAYIWGVLQLRRFPLTAFLLALIPFFHIKYTIPALMLASFIIWRQVRNGKFLRVLLFILIVTGGLALLLIYSRILYGDFNPGSIFPSGNYFSIAWRARFETFLAFFLDQRDGLLVYAPLTLFLFFGMRKGFRYLSPLLTVFFSYLAFHAFTTIRGAYSPAGRPLMFVYWIGAILIARYFFDSSEKPRRFFRFTAGMTFFSTFWLLLHPLFLYQPVNAGTTDGASSWLLFMGSAFIPLCRFFPSFLKTSVSWNWVNIAWIAALGLSILVFYFRKNETVFSRVSSFAAVPLFAAWAFLLCFFPHVYLNNSQKFVSREIAFFNPSRNFVFNRETGVFRVKAGSHYDIFIETAFVKKDAVTMHMLNTDQVEVEVRNGRKLLFRSGQSKEETFSLRFTGLRELKIGRTRVAAVGIQPTARIPGAFLFLRFE